MLTSHDYGWDNEEKEVIHGILNDYAKKSIALAWEHQMKKDEIIMQYVRKNRGKGT